MKADRRAVDRDEGAILIWTGLMMTVLLGVGALVVDIGALYVEKRQLQNGADAAALAVAQDCANGACGTGFPLAQQYAALNANDGAANVSSVCGEGPGLAPCGGQTPPGADGAAGWVRVGTSTRSADGGDEVHFVFAPFIGAITGSTVNASASAAWGPVGEAVARPLVFSACEFVLAGGSVDGAGSVPAGKHAILFHDSSPADPERPCNIGPAGKDLPGGFGFIGETGPCEAALRVGQVASTSPGNSLSGTCKSSIVGWRNTVQIFPMYDSATGNGANGSYGIAGFVGIRITGYNFNGNSNDWGDTCANSPSDTCIIGEFTAVSLTAGKGFSTGFDFGVHSIQMVG